MSYELELMYYDEIMKKYVEKYHFQTVERENEHLKRENEHLKRENECLKRENECLKNKNHELNKFIETIMSNFNLHIKNETTFNSIKQGVQSV
jgi:predicted RNase H-like nuclease (RuvC/YqgF family)